MAGATNRAASAAVVLLALTSGGTSSGDQGVICGKQRYDPGPATCSRISVNQLVGGAIVIVVIGLVVWYLIDLRRVRRNRSGGTGPRPSTRRGSAPKTPKRWTVDENSWHHHSEPNDVADESERFHEINTAAGRATLRMIRATKPWMDFILRRGRPRPPFN